MLFVARVVTVSTRAFMAKRHVAYGVAAQPDANLCTGHVERGADESWPTDENRILVTHVYAWFTPGTVGTVAE